MYRYVFVVVVVIILGWACGGGTRFTEAGKAASELKGRVIKGPVSSATVVAYKESATLERGEVLAQTTSDQSGDFTLSLPPYQGHVLIVAKAGAYIEEALGIGVQLGDIELQLLLPEFATGTKLAGLRVTPISTLAAAFTKLHASSGRPVADANRDALAHLHHHFGEVDWSTVTPADLSLPGVTSLSPEARAGVVLGGLSWLAKQHAEASGLTPGLVVNSATLSALLARDAADGTFDGRSGVQPLSHAKSALTGLTMRGELVRGITGFINSPRNASTLKLQDVTALLAAIGTDNDPYLFCVGQVASTACGLSPIDTEPPVVVFTRPSDGAGAAGSTQVEVHASDNVGLATLKFTAPASLALSMPTFSNGNREGSLIATLDVSALADGPIDVTVEATDTSGTPTAKSITVRVSNNGPTIVISTPSAGSMIRGTVTLTASASPRAAGTSIASLALSNPPPGFAADTLPSADSLSASWDSALAPEGPTVLTLRAVDSLGTATDVSVSVIVDNVAPGRVSAFVSAGAPLDGLKVKVVAIDDSTGLPVVGRVGGSVLGESTSVTASGVVDFVLTQENYSGPVQLVAQGEGVTYVDPSDGTTSITLPAGFLFTSYVANYHSGESLSRPLTYWASLADVAALAFAQGRNASQPRPVKLSSALGSIDPLFARHITTSPWSSREVSPVSLTTKSQSLRDVVYAAFPDVALNQEARSIAEAVGLTPGAGFAAPQLVAMLAQDIADGHFDGKANGVQLQTAGTSPYSLDANTTRFRQAIALDAFIRGAQNRTQLTRQDLQTSNIFDTISGDTSLLYPSSSPPTAFDNAPPTQTWQVTFPKDGSTPAVPVSDAHLVRGLVQLTVTGTDSSGMSSLGVAVGAQTLSPTSGSTPALFAASFDVSAQPDGPLVFTATACDKLSNCGTSTYAITIDNTAPTLHTLRPSSNAFISASFDIEATSNDVNGLDQFAVLSPAALVDVDTSVARIFVPSSGWSMSWPEGSNNVTLRSCDVVGNCKTLNSPVAVDRTAPRVAITSSVPQFTNQSPVTISGTVSDSGAGVRRLLVSVNGQVAQAASVTGGTWSLSVALQPNTTNTVTVWAEDLASPPNGSSSGSVPSVATATIVTDMTPPVVLTRAPASYRDERNLRVATDAQGRPVMPPSYQYAGGLQAVEENGTVSKIKAKSGVGDDNTPFLRWAVQRDASPASPVGSASFLVRFINGALCGDCLWTTMRDSAASEAGYALFEMPLHLGTLVSPGIINVRARFTDAAGNTTSRDFAITYQLVGAPLVVVADASLPSYADPASIFPYTPSSSYPSLIGTSKRLLRWVLYNPNQETVWASLDTPGLSSSWTETWVEGRVYAPGGSMSDVGQTWYDYVDWFSKAYDASWPPWDSECQGGNRHGISPFPCAQQAASVPIYWNPSPRPTHYMGDSGAFYRCESAPGLSGSNSAFPLTNVLSTSGGLSVMANPLPTGNESTPASSVTLGNGSTGWAVPPATAATASAIVVYAMVTTPVRAPSAIAAAGFPLAGTGSQSFRAGWFYKWEANDSQLACQICRGIACLTYHADLFNQGWQAYYFDRSLASMQVSYSGALAVGTYPALASSSGTVASFWPSVPFNLSYAR